MDGLCFRDSLRVCVTWAGYFSLLTFLLYADFSQWDSHLLKQRSGGEKHHDIFPMFLLTLLFKRLLVISRVGEHFMKKWHFFPVQPTLGHWSALYFLSTQPPPTSSSQSTSQGNRMEETVIFEIRKWVTYLTFTASFIRTVSTHTNTHVVCLSGLQILRTQPLLFVYLHWGSPDVWRCSG